MLCWEWSVAATSFPRTSLPHCGGQRQRSPQLPGCTTKKLGRANSLRDGGRSAVSGLPPRTMSPAPNDLPIASCRHFGRDERSGSKGGQYRRRVRQPRERLREKPCGSAPEGPVLARCESAVPNCGHPCLLTHKRASGRFDTPMCESRAKRRPSQRFLAICLEIGKWTKEMGYLLPILICCARSLLQSDCKKRMRPLKGPIASGPYRIRGLSHQFAKFVVQFRNMDTLADDLSFGVDHIHRGKRQDAKLVRQRAVETCAVKLGPL